MPSFLFAKSKKEIVMSSDQFLRNILSRYVVNASGAMAAGKIIYPDLEQWGNNYLVSTDFSGSLAKGTANSIGTDADIFLSLSSTTPGTLADMYGTLYNAVTSAGYTARKQNVSIGVKVNGYSIDLVPGRRQSQYGNDHSLYRNKAGSWTQTNIATHIDYVKNSGRVDEIRVLKIWRELHGLTFPSFFLEMATINALHYARHGSLADNVWSALEHFRTNIKTVSYIDPANTNNIVSDDCTQIEKSAIAIKAAESLSKPNWSQIVW